MATGKGSSGRFEKKTKKNVRAQNLIQNNNKEDSWKTGRRIVELGLLSENLKCSCGNNLHLKDIKSETRYGLGSILHIKCLSCENVVKVSTGKRHKSKEGDTENGAARCFDVNTKLAAGM